MQPPIHLEAIRLMIVYVSPEPIECRVRMPTHTPATSVLRELMLPGTRPHVLTVLITRIRLSEVAQLMTVFSNPPRHLLLLLARDHVLCRPIQLMVPISRAGPTAPLVLLSHGLQVVLIQLWIADVGINIADQLVDHAHPFQISMVDGVTFHHVRYHVDVVSRLVYVNALHHRALAKHAEVTVHSHVLRMHALVLKYARSLHIRIVVVTYPVPINAPSVRSTVGHPLEVLTSPIVYAGLVMRDRMVDHAELSFLMSTVVGVTLPNVQQHVVVVHRPVCVDAQPLMEPVLIVLVMKKLSVQTMHVRLTLHKRVSFFLVRHRPIRPVVCMYQMSPNVPHVHSIHGHQLVRIISLIVYAGLAILDQMVDHVPRT